MTEEHEHDKAPSFRSLAFSFWKHPAPKSGREKKIVMTLACLWGIGLGLLLSAGAFWLGIFGEPMPFSNVEMVDENGNRMRVSAKDLSKLIKGIEDVQEVRTYPDGSTKTFRFGDYYKVEEPAKP
jgi:hypothetical protein